MDDPVDVVSHLNSLAPEMRADALTERSSMFEDNWVNEGIALGLITHALGDSGADCVLGLIGSFSSHEDPYRLQAQVLMAPLVLRSLVKGGKTDAVAEIIAGMDQRHRELVLTQPHLDPYTAKEVAGAVRLALGPDGNPVRSAVLELKS